MTTITSARSYEVSPELSETFAGWWLYCFDGDDCIYQMPCRTKDDAIEHGDKYLAGDYDQGFPI